MRNLRLSVARRGKHRGGNPRSRRGSFVGEMLEDRRMLAQTTGLFFNNPGTSDGYVLFAPNTSTTTYLIDKEATVIKTWQSNYSPGLLGYLLPDGSLLRDAAPHGQGGNGFINAAGAGGLLERFDWDGSKTWEFAYDSPTHLAHHDFEVMPNGNILLIAWELKSEAQATAAGRDPNLPGAGYLYPDHIVEVQPDLVNGGGTIVWEWHVWDHLVQEFDSTKANWYGATGVDDHPELIDVNYVSTFSEGGGQAEDWTHANGIDYNPHLDQIVLSVREFSEFWIIDHSTTTAEAAGHTGGNSGRGGDLLYRWGNPQTYDRGTASDRVFYYQHDAKWIEDDSPGAGHITVFNNGFGKPGTDVSSVEEIITPVNGSGQYPALAPGQPHGPAAPAATYTGPVASFSAIISSAQRLPNGNTLIDYGVNGNFSEVTAAGTEVWKFVNPYTGAGTLGPMDPIPSLGVPGPGLNALRTNFTFQAIHYQRDDFDFVGDVNDDGYVNLLDVQVVGLNWQTAGPAGDANHDGIVNLVDVQVVGLHWNDGLPPGTGMGGGAAAASAARMQAAVAEGSDLSSNAAGVVDPPSVEERSLPQRAEGNPGVVRHEVDAGDVVLGSAIGTAAAREGEGAAATDRISRLPAAVYGRWLEKALAERRADDADGAASTKHDDANPGHTRRHHRAHRAEAAADQLFRRLGERVQACPDTAPREHGDAG